MPFAIDMSVDEYLYEFSYLHFETMTSTCGNIWTFPYDKYVDGYFMKVCYCFITSVSDFVPWYI